MILVDKTENYLNNLNAISDNAIYAFNGSSVTGRPSFYQGLVFSVCFDKWGDIQIAFNVGTGNEKFAYRLGKGEWIYP